MYRARREGCIVSWVQSLICLINDRDSDRVEGGIRFGFCLGILNFLAKALLIHE